jgi:hypothetical protein
MLIAIAVQGIARGEVIRFDHATTGSPPAGWTVAMTHAGGAPNSSSRGVRIPGFGRKSRSASEMASIAFIVTLWTCRNIDEGLRTLLGP